MSNQPRMFTAKRHSTQTAAQAQRQEHRHRNHHHHAKAQESRTQAREIVEDVYGDLS